MFNHLERSMTMERNILRRNYLLHSLEGGLYMGGMQFIAPEAVLPRMIDTLGGPAWMISLMPIALFAGISLPGLFMAHRIEQFHLMKPLILVSGLFQRLPLILAALGLLFLWPTHPGVALCLAFLAPLLSGLAGGITFTAWQELLAKTLPRNRRASVFAVRYILMSSLGLASGCAIAAILTLFPGAAGYGLLYLCAFCFTLLSYLLFAFIVEKPHPPTHHGPPLSLGANLSAIPSLLRTQPAMRRFNMAQVMSTGIYIVLPFLAIHALRVTNQPDSYIGFFVAAQMIGSIVGNTLAGYAGDRWGGKVPCFWSSLLILGLFVWLPFCRSESSFITGFALLGAAMFGLRVGLMCLRLEVCPEAKRSTNLAVSGFLLGLAMLGAAALSAWLWGGPGFNALCAVSALMLAAAAACFQSMPARDGH